MPYLIKNIQDINELFPYTFPKCANSQWAWDIV